MYTFPICNILSFNQIPQLPSWKNITDEILRRRKVVLVKESIIEKVSHAAKEGEQRLFLEYRVRAAISIFQVSPTTEG